MNAKTHQQIQQFGQLAGIALIILLVLGASQPITEALIQLHPKRIPTTSLGFTPADMDLTYEDITFEATDGVRLSGWYIQPLGEANGAAVIVSHAYGNNRTLAMWHAFALAQAGYAALVYDHRAHGSSEGEISGTGWAEDRDVLGAVAYLQSRSNVTWIGAAGLSLGAVASLRAAAQNNAIRAVWSDGAGGITFGDNMPPCNFSEVVTTPSWLLYFGAKRLFTGLPRPAPMTATLTEIAPRPTMLVIANQNPLEACAHRHWLAHIDTSHIQTWFVETGHISSMETHRDELMRRLVAFFDAAFNGS